MLGVTHFLGPGVCPRGWPGFRSSVDSVGDCKRQPNSSRPPTQALLVRRVFAVLLVKGQRLFSRLFFVCRPPESEPVCHFEADEEVWGGGVWPGQGRARGRRPGSPGRHRWECVRVTCK